MVEYFPNIDDALGSSSILGKKKKKHAAFYNINQERIRLSEISQV